MALGAALARHASTWARGECVQLDGLVIVQVEEVQGPTLEMIGHVGSWGNISVLYVF